MAAPSKRILFGKVFAATAFTMVAGGAVDLLTKPFENSSVPGMLLALGTFLSVAFVISLVWYGALLSGGNAPPPNEGRGGRAKTGAGPDHAST